MPGHSKDTAGTKLVSLANEEAVREILSTTVLDLWKVVNTLTRLRPSTRDRYRVAMFGSAHARPGTFVYDEVKRVAQALASTGCDIVTDVPLILVGKMWRGGVEWARTSMLDTRLALANAEDLQIPHRVDTADEAVAMVRQLHAAWQSRQ